MKIIFSRKGFDSGSGGMPSPIMPDGTLLSLPIPADEGKWKYNQLIYVDEYGKKNYFDIIKELSPTIARHLEEKGCRCHVDPDLLNRYAKKPEGWEPAFGQCGNSLRHLQKNHIGVGDKDDEDVIFLFYGWFRKTEYYYEGKEIKLRFVRPKEDDTPDRHIIWGYMESDKVITNQDIIKKDYDWHPHASKEFEKKYKKCNALFLPKEICTFNKSRAGCGVLKYSPVRQLTMKNHKRSEWTLPGCFDKVKISHNEKKPYGWTKKNDFFRAANRGQEFIVESEVTPAMEDWLTELLKTD